MKQNPTITDVINELMFIAIAKPEKVDVEVTYLGYVDAVKVKAFGKTYFRDKAERTLAAYRQSLVLDEIIYLDEPFAVKNAMTAYGKLISIIDPSAAVSA